jgi:hypothetical protein
VLTYVSKPHAPATDAANPGVGSIPVPHPPPHNPPVIKKFAALCVNIGEFNKALGEIEVSSLSTDRQVFQKFKEKYRTLRGSRASTLRWLLIKPVDIRFIQVCGRHS